VSTESGQVQIPVRCWVWPGNTNDQTVIAEVKRDLTGWRLGRAIYIVDSGFSGQDNLRHRRSAGGHYIAGIKMRLGMPETEPALSRPGRYRTPRDNLRVKEVNVGDGDARGASSSAATPPRPSATARAANSASAGSRPELARLKLQRKRAKTKAEREAHQRGECALRNHKTLSRYLRQTTTGRLVIDRDKLRAEQRLDTCSPPQTLAVGRRRRARPQAAARGRALLPRPQGHAAAQSSTARTSASARTC
jgi:hypothetical protein